MRHITIALADEIYFELERAAADVHELTYGVATYAQELIESEMATRRLSKVRIPITTEGVERKAIEFEEVELT